MGNDTPLLKAFGAVDDVLSGAVQGIADLIIRPGMINVDFADVKTVMSEMGLAMMGSGSATGENRAREAAEAAIHSPLLDDIDFNGSRGILVNIAAGEDISLGEFSEVGATIEEFASDNATIVVGTVIDANMGDELRVTVVATGLGHPELDKPRTVVDNTQKIIAGDGPTDYSEFDKPTITRNKPSEERVPDLGSSKDMQYLDIPAFLRRQAD